MVCSINDCKKSKWVMNAKVFYVLFE